MWRYVPVCVMPIPIQDSYRKRIKPVAGDLSKERFGLTPAEFQRLADSVDVIVHNGVLKTSPHTIEPIWVLVCPWSFCVFSRSLAWCTALAAVPCSDIPTCRCACALAAPLQEVKGHQCGGDKRDPSVGMHGVTQSENVSLDRCSLQMEVNVYIEGPSGVA